MRLWRPAVWSFVGIVTIFHSGRITAVRPLPNTAPVSMPTACSVTNGFDKTECPKINRSGPFQKFVQNVKSAGAFDGQCVFFAGGRMC